MPNHQQLRDIQRAMRAPEQWVLQVEYEDSQGNKSVRIVSPIRYLSAERLLALCLCRCEPRQFYLNRCSKWELKPAAEYVMPVDMAHVELAHVDTAQAS